MVSTRSEPGLPDPPFSRVSNSAGERGFCPLGCYGKIAGGGPSGGLHAVGSYPTQGEEGFDGPDQRLEIVVRGRSGQTPLHVRGGFLPSRSGAD